jgi:hypothetical protein
MIATVASAAAFATGGLLLAACGGSSSSSSSPSASTPTQQAHSTAVAQQTAAGSATHSGSGGSSKAASGKRSAQADAGAGGRTGQSTGARGPTHVSSLPVPKGPNPCVLVTGAEAEAILGAPIAAKTEAPLGPTCILKVKGQQQTVTLAVESLSVSNEVRQMHKPRRLTVAGHAAYCGTLGRPMLDVSLSGSKILNVTAPCTVAEALAAKALGRITA